MCFLVCFSIYFSDILFDIFPDMFFLLCFSNMFSNTLFWNVSRETFLVWNTEMIYLLRSNRKQWLLLNNVYLNQSLYDSDRNRFPAPLWVLHCTASLFLKTSIITNDSLWTNHIANEIIENLRLLSSTNVHFVQIKILKQHKSIRIRESHQQLSSCGFPLIILIMHETYNSPFKT